MAVSLVARLRRVVRFALSTVAIAEELAAARLDGYHAGFADGGQAAHEARDEALRTLRASYPPSKRTACPRCGGTGRRLAPVGGYYPHASRSCPACDGVGRSAAS